MASHRVESARSRALREVGPTVEMHSLEQAVKRLGMGRNRAVSYLRAAANALLKQDGAITFLAYPPNAERTGRRFFVLESAIKKAEELFLEDFPFARTQPPKGAMTFDDLLETSRLERRLLDQICERHREGCNFYSRRPENRTAVSGKTLSSFCMYYPRDTAKEILKEAMALRKELEDKSKKVSLPYGTYRRRPAERQKFEEILEEAEAVIGALDRQRRAQEAQRAGPQLIESFLALFDEKHRGDLEDIFASKAYNPDSAALVVRGVSVPLKNIHDAVAKKLYEATKNSPPRLIGSPKAGMDLLALVASELAKRQIPRRNSRHKIQK